MLLPSRTINNNDLMYSIAACEVERYGNNSLVPATIDKTESRSFHDAAPAAPLFSLLELQHQQPVIEYTISLS